MTIQEIQQAIQEGSRPMKWESAENIAKVFIKDCLKAHNQLTKEFIDLLRQQDEDIPQYNSIRSGFRKGKSVKPKVSGCGCDPVEKRDTDSGDIARLRAYLAEYLTVQQLRDIEGLFRGYQDVFFTQGIPNASIFGTHIPEAWQDGYNRAYFLLAKAGMDDAIVNAIQFNTANRFVGEYLTVAFQRVTSKVSLSMKGLYLGEVVTGLQNGLNWTQIARNVYRNANIGAFWHWKRLVRTEMVIGHTKTFLDTYTQAGVGYVFYSPSMNACPICKPDRGYWSITGVPQPPRHPNCRCVLTPISNLPQGATVKG